MTRLGGGIVIGLMLGVTVTTAPSLFVPKKGCTSPVREAPAQPAGPAQAAVPPQAPSSRRDKSSAPVVPVAPTAQKDDAFYEAQLRRQLELCGALCEVGGRAEKVVSDGVLPARRAPVDCPRLFSTDELESSAEQWPPPLSIPKPLRGEYEKFSTKATRVKVTQASFAERYSGGEAMEAQWTEKLVEDYIRTVRDGTMRGNYGQAAVAQVREAARRLAPNRTVLVIGSENPWVESIALAEGASHVYVLEYGKINSTHPKITTFTPHEFNELYRQARLPKIESMMTYSSLEHSGLGRYGDTLNPWGDVLQVAKIWCILPDDALIAVGVEGSTKKRDHIRWNLDRQYGPRRLPYLLSNFRTEAVLAEMPQVLTLARKLPPV